MSILAACILAVLMALIGATAASVLKTFLRVGGDDLTFFLGVAVTAIISSISITGGMVYGDLNPGMWPNIGNGVMIWFITAFALTVWACLILGQDASDVLKRMILYGVLIAFLTAVWLAVYRTGLAAPIRLIMKAATHANLWVYREIAVRIFPE